MSDEQAAYNKGFSSRRLKDIGLVGAGTALGGGLGWLVGDKLATAVLSNPRSAMAVRIGLPVAGGLAAGYASSLELRRREVEQERAHQAGIEALMAHQIARDKAQKVSLQKEAEASSSLELQADPGDLGIHDKRTGESNRALAYSHNMHKGLVGGAALGAAHRAATGMGLTEGVYRAVKDKGVGTHLRGMQGVLVPSAAERFVDNIGNVARSGHAADVIPDLANHATSLVDWKKVGKRALVGGLAGAAAGGAALKMLGNVTSYEKHKALAARPADQAAQTKVARILAGPQEWTESEKTTGKGAALGALGGLAVAGVSAVKPSYGAFAVPGAIAGALLARHNMRKRRQEQGYA